MRHDPFNKDEDYLVYLIVNNMNFNPFSRAIHA